MGRTIVIDEGARELNNKIIETLAENDFSLISISLQDDNHIAEVETFSPKGEDVIVTVWYDGTDDGFIEAFKEYADDFDADEHAEMWVEFRGTNDVPKSIRDLIDDADAIKSMLEDMVQQLTELEIEDDEEEDETEQEENLDE